MLNSGASSEPDRERKRGEKEEDIAREREREQKIERRVKIDDKGEREILHSKTERSERASDAQLGCFLGARERERERHTQSARKEQKDTCTRSG